jgi:acetaldehyde dehydrogenase (acetylating)
MDTDLRSIQQARELVSRAKAAQRRYKEFSQEQVDRVVDAMVDAGIREAERLGRFAHEETGFGRPESKKAKNLFATKTLRERMQGMRTIGIVAKKEGDSIWEVATPMGVVAALIPSTNPTSTAMYKAIISAKAGCGIVMSPHPRAVKCTAEALNVVAEAAYRAGAPKGLFACMTEVSLDGTDALLEHPEVDVILATGGNAMVRAAYSKGKPAYGVGSGNVPVYVDRSADVEKAAKDILYGTSFDWGTLCSTERSVVADAPIKSKLVEAMKRNGAYFMNDDEKDKVRRVVMPGGRFNADQVGQSPKTIARMAGFSVPESTKALVGEVTKVGREETLSMETLSPILSFYCEDGWQAGCNRCIDILEFGGIGHTLAIHCNNDRVIEEFALKKPSMRIVVNSVAALGSVGYTNRLFPAMTLGPGTLGGSITSDNVSPLHLLNIKRVAFETEPINPPSKGARASTSSAGGERAIKSGKDSAVKVSTGRSWMDEIDARLRARAGNSPVPAAQSTGTGSRPERSEKNPASVSSSGMALSEEQISSLVKKFRK